MARPYLELNEDIIEKLASIHCTMEEMALIMGCSVDTLERNYADIIKRGKANAKQSLRRIQWESALKGNVAMMIWMGKQLLGQKDISRVELSEIPDEMFEREAERRLKLVGEYASLPAVKKTSD